MAVVAALVLATGFMPAQAEDPFALAGLPVAPRLQKTIVKSADYSVWGRGKPNGYMGMLGIAINPSRTRASSNTPVIPATRSTAICESGSLRGPVEVYELGRPKPSGAWICHLYLKPTVAGEHRVYELNPWNEHSGEPVVPMENGRLVQRAKLNVTSRDLATGVIIPNVDVASSSSAMTLVVTTPESGHWKPSATDRFLVKRTPLGSIAIQKMPGITLSRANGQYYSPTPYSAYTRAPLVHLFGNESGEVTFVVPSDNELMARTYRGGKFVSEFAFPLYHGAVSSVSRAANGDYYYFTHGRDRDPPASIVRTDAAGKLLARADLDSAVRGFDFLSLVGTTSSIAIADRGVCLISSRNMHSGHQGAFAATFERESLKLIKYYGQTSGHSFANRATVDGENFVTMDLGDNFPRGIALSKLWREEKEMRVVFTYKTEHESRPRPATEGEAVREPFRWSNDNRTYTQLGDIVPTRSGYLVLFSSERDTENTNTKTHHNSPRNLGMVLVRRDFERVKQTDYIVTPDLVISTGASSSPFGFYDYSGKHKQQQNAGVMWLTSYRDKNTDNAVYPSIVTLTENRYLIIWEHWAAHTYQETFAMVVNESGLEIHRPVSFGGHSRIPENVLPRRVGSYVIWPSYHREWVYLNVLELPQSLLSD